MKTRSERVPAYRLHKPSGQAVVTLNGQDHYLGRHDTQASRDAYNERIVTWLSHGRTLPLAEQRANVVCVADVCDAFLKWCQREYRDEKGNVGREVKNIRLALRPLVFYDSARAGAPRFILLDEAFAGIDRQTRGELMGLLADFDLDFVMTSFEEWGFYPQLDGLSTYHLAREKGMPGVYADWFVWNGHEPVQMQP